MDHPYTSYTGNAAMNYAPQHWPQEVQADYTFQGHHREDYTHHVPTSDVPADGLYSAAVQVYDAQPQQSYGAVDENAYVQYQQQQPAVSGWSPDVGDSYPTVHVDLPGGYEDEQTWNQPQPQPSHYSAHVPAMGYDTQQQHQPEQSYALHDSSEDGVRDWQDWVAQNQPMGMQQIQHDVHGFDGGMSHQQPEQNLNVGEAQYFTDQGCYFTPLPPAPSSGSSGSSSTSSLANATSLAHVIADRSQRHHSQDKQRETAYTDQSDYSSHRPHSSAVDLTRRLCNPRVGEGRNAHAAMHSDDGLADPRRMVVPSQSHYANALQTSSSTSSDSTVTPASSAPYNPPIPPSLSISLPTTYHTSSQSPVHSNISPTAPRRHQPLAIDHLAMSQFAQADDIHTAERKVFEVIHKVEEEEIMMNNIGISRRNTITSPITPTSGSGGSPLTPSDSWHGMGVLTELAPSSPPLRVSHKAQTDISLIDPELHLNSNGVVEKYADVGGDMGRYFPFRSPKGEGRYIEYPYPEMAKPLSVPAPPVTVNMAGSSGGSIAHPQPLPHIPMTVSSKGATKYQPIHPHSQYHDPPTTPPLPAISHTASGVPNANPHTHTHIGQEIWRPHPFDGRTYFKTGENGEIRTKGGSHALLGPPAAKGKAPRGYSNGEGGGAVGGTGSTSLSGGGSGAGASGSHGHGRGGHGHNGAGPHGNGNGGARRKVITEKPGPKMACHFCRGRKIACSAALPGSVDPTCNQCARRSIKCVYPEESRRGMRKKEKSAHTVDGVRQADKDGSGPSSSKKGKGKAKATDKDQDTTDDEAGDDMDMDDDTNDQMELGETNSEPTAHWSDPPAGSSSLSRGASSSPASSSASRPTHAPAQQQQQLARSSRRTTEPALIRDPGALPSGSERPLAPPSGMISVLTNGQPLAGPVPGQRQTHAPSHGQSSQGQSGRDGPFTHQPLSRAR